MLLEESEDDDFKLDQDPLLLSSRSVSGKSSVENFVITNNSHLLPLN